MSRIEFDASGEHVYETGAKYGVLYQLNSSTKKYEDGVAWNGITSVSEAPSGAEASPIYADDIKYLNLVSAEEFGCTIEAYTYPDEFEQNDGSASIGTGISIGQQTRKTFGFCYRTVVGNELDPNAGYKLHLIYGCQAAPSERSYQTINDSPEAITFSWEINTTPVNVTGQKPTSIVTIDSTKTGKAIVSAMEAILYGCDPAAFDSTKAYKIGDIVSQATKTYVCVADAEAGEFDADNFVELEGVSASSKPRMPLPDEIAELVELIEG